MDKYAFKKYDYIERWISYWHQIDEVCQLGPESVLEIGPGNKTTSGYLKGLGIEVKTMDVDDTAGADAVGTVLRIPFLNSSFDLVLCAEVLEHLPFSDFSLALGEIKRVTKKYAVLSLPHWGWLFYFKFKLPILGSRKIFFKISGFKKHPAGGQHFWEIGKVSYSLGKIKKIIQNEGFKIVKDFIDPDSSYHHFFILEKI